MKTHVVTTAAPTSALIQNNPVAVLIAGKFDLPQPAARRTELLIDPKPTSLRIEPLRLGQLLLDRLDGAPTERLEAEVGANSGRRPSP